MVFPLESLSMVRLTMIGIPRRLADFVRIVCEA